MKGKGYLFPIAAGILCLAFGIFYLIRTYSEGEAARRQSDQLLEEFNHDLEERVPPDTTSSASSDGREETTPLSPNQTSSLSGITADGQGEPAWAEPEELDSPEPEQEAMAASEALKENIIGKLAIPALDVELPVLGQTTAEYLKITICRYQGSLPDEEGNLVIAGHNYLNGSHFGTLQKIAVGDEIIFTGQDGAAYTYQVYETSIIRPDEVEGLDNDKSAHTLTLFTCTDDGKKRFVVKCEGQ